MNPILQELRNIRSMDVGDPAWRPWRKVPCAEGLRVPAPWVLLEFPELGPDTNPAHIESLLRLRLVKDSKSRWRKRRSAPFAPSKLMVDDDPVRFQEFYLTLLSPRDLSVAEQVRAFVRSESTQGLIRRATRWLTEDSPNAKTTLLSAVVYLVAKTLLVAVMNRLSLPFPPSAYPNYPVWEACATATLLLGWKWVTMSHLAGYSSSTFFHHAILRHLRCYSSRFDHESSILAVLRAWWRDSKKEFVPFAATVIYFAPHFFACALSIGATPLYLGLLLFPEPYAGTAAVCIAIGVVLLSLFGPVPAVWRRTHRWLRWNARRRAREFEELLPKYQAYRLRLINEGKKLPKFL